MCVVYSPWILAIFFTNHSHKRMLDTKIFDFSSLYCSRENSTLQKVLLNPIQHVIAPPKVK